MFCTTETLFFLHLGYTDLYVPIERDYGFATLEGFTEVTMKNNIFQDVNPCSLIHIVTSISEAPDASIFRVEQLF